MVTVSWDNVLVLQTSFLGDTVLTLPLISEIKRRFPVKRLSVVCLPLSRELLQDYSVIDEVIVDDKKDLDRGFAGLKRTAAALKSRRFTLALTPHKSLRSALLLHFAGIPYRVGFRQSRGWFLFQKRVHRDSTRHDVERNLSLLRAFGIAVENCQRELALPVSRAIQDSVDAKLSSLGIAEKKITIGLNPGSVWPTKRWSTAGFARLTELLKQRYDCQVLLFGGAEDAETVADVQSRCGCAGINLVGEISLRHLAAAIGRCHVFVTNDSAPMHVAVARKVPVVALFCATSPSLGFYPYSSNAIVLEKNLSCRPCASHGGRRCPLGSEDCIRQIHPEAVLNAIERLLPMDTPAGPRSAELLMPQVVTV
jgi:heptosyltransferase-2